MASPAALRASFIEKFKNEDDPGFHPHDLERIKDDRYLLRVLNHSDRDLTQATEMLFEIFTWRKTVDANEINESNIRMDYVKEGVIFPHGRDFDGCLLLIIKCKKHVKGQKDFDEIKRVIIYWFDRIEREENGKKITLFFDLENCGLANMDMDLINYMIMLFKYYYPYFLNFILIFQMPWVMTAAFKIIRSLLPARGVHKLKLVTRETLKDFVLPEQALTCWGGLDNYVFEFVPETKTDAGSKKVTFSEQGDKNQYSPGELLQLIPNETIYFKMDNNEITGKLTIKNMDDKPVSFKIRTTAPEKFRVRPSSGVLATGASQTIVIIVQPGFNMRTTVKDRFLILAVQIPKVDMTQKELLEIWQTTSDSKVDEYRLKCHFPERPKLQNSNREDDIAEMEAITEILQSMEEKQVALNESLQRVRYLQFITILFTAIAIILGMCTFFHMKGYGKYFNRNKSWS